MALSQIIKPHPFQEILNYKLPPQIKPIFKATQNVPSPRRQYYEVRNLACNSFICLVSSCAIIISSADLRGAIATFVVTLAVMSVIFMFRHHSLDDHKQTIDIYKLQHIYCSHKQLTAVQCCCGSAPIADGRARAAVL